MASHRLWAAYKALTPTQMIVLASGGGIAAGTVVYALTAATDPEQRLARAREEMMRIPRLRRAGEDALAEARQREEASDMKRKLAEKVLRRIVRKVNALLKIEGAAPSGEPYLEAACRTAVKQVGDQLKKEPGLFGGMRGMMMPVILLNGARKPVIL